MHPTLLLFLIRSLSNKLVSIALNSPHVYPPLCLSTSLLPFFSWCTVERNRCQKNTIHIYVSISAQTLHGNTAKQKQTYVLVALILLQLLYKRMCKAQAKMCMRSLRRLLSRLHCTLLTLVLVLTPTQRQQKHSHALGEQQKREQELSRHDGLRKS